MPGIVNSQDVDYSEGSDAEPGYFTPEEAPSQLNEEDYFEMAMKLDYPEGELERMKARMKQCKLQIQSLDHAIHVINLTLDLVEELEQEVVAQPEQKIVALYEMKQEVRAQIEETDQKIDGIEQKIVEIGQKIDEIKQKANTLRAIALADSNVLKALAAYALGSK